ncbi:beta-gamma-crystallin [Yersinia bercovieri]|nr:beta-gamma-crystallin [Yersinia bercovieri]
MTSIKNKRILLFTLIYQLFIGIAFATENKTKSTIYGIDNTSKENTQNCLYYKYNTQGNIPCQNTSNIIDETWVPIGKDSKSGVKTIDCDTDCHISNTMTLPLSAIFPQESSDTQNQERSLLLSFEVTNNTFDITFDNFMDITVDDGMVLIMSPDSQRIDFLLHQATTHISFLFSWLKNELSLSFLETAQGKLLHLSPIISMPLGSLINQDPIDLTIFNSNFRQPLVLQKVMMAVHDEPHRAKRGVAGIAGCFISGPLALYNVVTQGRCNQVESAWQHIKKFFAGEDASNRVVAGTSEPLKPKPVVVTTALKKAPPSLTLSQLNTGLHGQSLTLPAVSHYCEKPLEYVIGARFPRQIRYSCATWLSSVLADFTLLFGNSLRTWSTEYLIQTLNGILDRSAIDSDHDAIDAFIREPTAGNRLIQTINDVAEEQGRSVLIDSITQSFALSEQNYMQYAIINSPPEASNAKPYAHCHSESDYDYDYDSDNFNDGSSSSSSDSDIVSPLQAQQYPLGTYQMPISSYVYQDVLPRILHNGEWQVASERFDIEVIQGSREQTRHSLYELLETIATWENTYQEHRVSCDRHGIFPSDMATNRYAGQVTSQIIKSYSQKPRPGQTIIVVRFNHQIVSASVADSYSNGDSPPIKHGTIRATLTNPAYVLTPQVEGAIRGAGSAALHAMIQRLKADGVSMVEAEVISTPSAMIKKRIGFVFIPDELENYRFSPSFPSPTGAGL